MKLQFNIIIPESTFYLFINLSIFNSFNIKCLVFAGIFHLVKTIPYLTNQKQARLL